MTSGAAWRLPGARGRSAAFASRARLARVLEAFSAATPPTSRSRRFARSRRGVLAPRGGRQRKGRTPGPRTRRSPGSSKPLKLRRCSADRPRAGAPCADVDPSSHRAVADRGSASRCSAAGAAVAEPRPAATGPSYIEVARDGRIYASPAAERGQPRRRPESGRDRRLQEAALAAGGGSRRPERSRRRDRPHPASVLEFTLRYEVPSEAAHGGLAEALERLLPFLTIVAVVTAAGSGWCSRALGLPSRAHGFSRARRTVRTCNRRRPAPARSRRPTRAHQREFERACPRGHRGGRRGCPRAGRAGECAGRQASRVRHRVRRQDVLAPQAGRERPPPPRRRHRCRRSAPGALPYAVTYTPVRVSFESTFEAAGNVLWQLRDLPTFVEVRSAR